MPSTSLFVFALSALSALSTALPSTLMRKDACTPKVSYTISQFIKFIPDASNPNPQSVVFGFSDDSDPSISSHCQILGPIDPTVPIPCSQPSNGNIAAFLNGSVLTITETYTPCNSTGTANITGVHNVETMCIPSEPPIPMGYGELCEVLPQGSLTERWST